MCSSLEARGNVDAFLEKAFDFEIVARAGRKDIKDIVPRLVIVGFEDIDTYNGGIEFGVESVFKN